MMMPKENQKTDPVKSLDQMSADEIIELSGGQRKFNEKFYQIFNPPKKS